VAEAGTSKEAEVDYSLTEEQKMVKKLARQIAEDKIVPVRAELDEKGLFPTDIVKELAAADLFRIFIPEEYDGTGGGLLDLCIVVEELSRACAGVAASYAVCGLGSFPLLIAGNEEQNRRYLPRVAAGELLTAFALTEAEAGSDASNVQTTAVKKGDHYVLNGVKQFITNAGEAGLYTVIASTDRTKGTRGLSAFLVEKGAPGFSFGREENKMGIRASVQKELVFEDCAVPASHMLGRAGQGFLIAMKTLDKSRPGIAAQALGIAQGAYEEAVTYAKQRVQFGQAIISFQGISFMLSDMATQIEAGRSLLYSVCRYIDTGAKRISKEAAMAKVFCSDMAMRVTTDAVQVFGGYGYMRDYPVEKMMRDAKITQIYEGTNQIQRMVIGLNITKEASA
jgi:alkylation response protein AidB-like acyl-CoA dehydrogenase